MKSNERAGYSEELWSLIQLESELVRAGAYLRVFGSLPDEQAIATAAGWAGYEFTLYGLDNAER